MVAHIMTPFAQLNEKHINMKLKQILTIVVIGLACGALPILLSLYIPQNEPDPEHLQRRAFVNTQVHPAKLVQESHGIPVTLSVAIAAMTTEFGKDEAVTVNNSYFLLQATGGTDTLDVGEGNYIRAFTSTEEAYLDFAKEVSKQPFYSTVRGMSIQHWFPHLEKWGYGIKDFYEYYSELQQLETL